MKRTEVTHERPDYGIDAPYVIRNLTLAGAACLILAVAWGPLRWMYSPATSLLATAAVWYGGSKFGKVRFRETMMDSLPWRGDETVLDVGCGSGLLLVGAAKRLTSGTAFGVDVWRGSDLSNTGAEATLRNARIEGVADRVRVEEGDARRLPFGDGTFDAAVSLNVLHNISEREEREAALREIVRVLRPGGRIVIADFRNTGEYARFLRENGVADARRALLGWALFIPVFAATGRKPEG